MPWIKLTTQELNTKRRARLRRAMVRGFWVGLVLSVFLGPPYLLLSFRYGFWGGKYTREPDIPWTEIAVNADRYAALILLMIPFCAIGGAMVALLEHVGRGRSKLCPACDKALPYKAKHCPVCAGPIYILDDFRWEPDT